MLHSKTKLVGILLIILAAIIFILIAWKNTPDTRVPVVFSDKDMLTALWSEYKTNNLEATTTRTLDKDHDNITTSEGESYTMLRAVWMDDKQTFDSSYTWTKDNLQHSDDHLFSWLFGEESNGKYGVLTSQGGSNTASDADTDIALSLVFASKRWDDPQYLADAKVIISAIWKNEVVVINGEPYMTADNLEKSSASNPIINPSYFAPYAYRIFAGIDPNDNWDGLVQTSYNILNETSSSTLDKKTSDGLPPDWITIDRTTGAIAPATSGNLTTNFGFDALRVPFRIALDYEWNKDPEAKEYLDKLSFLTKEWQTNKSLASTYSHDSNVIYSAEAPSMYGGTIGYFIVSDPADAATIYNTKLKFLFDQDTNGWKSPLGYYDDNWAWFGIGLYTNQLPNLAAEQ